MYSYKHQDIATHMINPPVQNTWYTILDTTRNVQCWYIVIFQNNDDNTARNMNVRITIDGKTRTKTADYNLADNTYAYVYKGSALNNDISYNTSPITVYAIDFDQAIPISGQSVKIEYRMTSAAGTNLTIAAYAQYDTLEETY